MMNYRNKYVIYKKRIKSKGLEFKLSLWKFSFYIERNCYICNKPNAGGLDRIRNDIGYTDKNVAPCCFDCNRMKSNKTPEEFMEYLKRLNPNHSLFNNFNKIKDNDSYNRKSKSLQRLMNRMLTGDL